MEMDSDVDDDDDDVDDDDVDVSVVDDVCLFFFCAFCRLKLLNSSSLTVDKTNGKKHGDNSGCLAYPKKSRRRRGGKESKSALK